MVDEELVLRAAGGDRRAMEHLCSETWRQLYAFVYHKVQNREEAEDVTQETYERAYKALPRYTAGSFLGMLRTIALNVVRDRWRRSQSRGKVVALTEAAEAPGDLAEAVSDRADVREALQNLPDEQQEVLRLRIILGLSTAETARQMGRTEAAVRTLQYRAIQAMREAIA